MIGSFLKNLLLGLALLLVLAIAGGVLFLLCWQFGWDFQAIAWPLAALAAAAILLLVLRRLWIWFSRRRFKKNVLLQDPARGEALPGELEEALKRAFALGMEHMGTNSLKHAPLALLLQTPGAAGHELASAAAAQLPCEQKAPVRWHFPHGMALLVPACKLAAQEDREHRNAWERLLRCLNEANPAEPVSSFVVAVSATELVPLADTGLEGAAAARDLTARALSLRSCMDDVARLRKANIPLHLAVTDLETVPGFSGLLSRLSALARQELVGLTIESGGTPETHQDVRKIVASTLMAARERLERLILHEALRGNEPKGLDLELAASLERLAQGLTVFLETLLVPRVEGRTAFARGIYFTSLHALAPKKPAATALLPGAPPTNAAATNAAATDASASLSGAATMGAQGPTLLPSFVQEAVGRIARDCALYVCMDDSRKEDRPRALGYAVACLVLLGLSALFSQVTLHTLHVLDAGRKKWDQAMKEGPVTELESLLAQSDTVRHLAAGSRDTLVPVPGLALLSDATLSAGSLYVRNFDSMQNRVLDECGRLATQGPEGSYAAMQRVLWMSDLAAKALKHKTSDRPFPLDAQAGQSAQGAQSSQGAGTQSGQGAQGGTIAPTLWTPDFGQLYQTALSVSDPTRIANLQRRLASLSSIFLGQDAEAIFKRLSELSLARSPKDEFPMSRYWPNSPRGSAGFASVPAIYTAAGYRHLTNELDDLANEAGGGYHDQAFWKNYLSTYGDVWADFIGKTDNAWLVLDNVETLQRISASGQGLKDPYLRLVSDICLELAPLFEENSAPEWANDLRILRALLLVSRGRNLDGKDARGTLSVLMDATRLDGNDIDILQKAVRERRSVSFLTDGVNAVEEYLACLEELRATLEDADGCLALASIEFGGKDFGDPATTALAKARDALGKLCRSMGQEYSPMSQRRGQKLSPALALMEGPLRFLEQAVAYNAAARLQRMWESEVLPQAMLTPHEELVEGLFGEKGLVTTFTTAHAAPFLDRAVGVHVARAAAKVTFPFADAFLGFMQEGKTAEANPLQEEYKLAVHTSAPDVNPDSAERMEYYEVTLACKKGKSSVRNANYPQEAVFDYLPKECGKVTLSMSFPSVKLEQEYEDFRHFLEEFALGERVFTSADFPNQANLMERFRINRINVRIRVDDGEKVVSAYTGDIAIPNRIVSIW